MLVFGLPVRGAVAHGEMYVDEENSLFLGKALTRAYELEQRQNWICVALDESVIEAYPGLWQEGEYAWLTEALFPRYEVTMKSGRISSLRTVNWRFNLVVAEGTESLFDDKGDWPARAKIEGALNYAYAMRLQGFAYPPAERVMPLEVRPFLIGGEQHGGNL